MWILVGWAQSTHSLHLAELCFLFLLPQLLQPSSKQTGLPGTLVLPGLWASSGRSVLSPSLHISSCPTSDLQCQPLQSQETDTISFPWTPNCADCVLPAHCTGCCLISHLWRNFISESWSSEGRLHPTHHLTWCLTPTLNSIKHLLNEKTNGKSAGDLDRT